MNWLHALILGLIQGVTEFFPISSSAHLKVFKSFFGISTGEETVLFDLFCHAGTLLALIFYFRKEFYELFFVYPHRLILFMTALLPLLPFYFLMKPLRDAAGESAYLGYCLMGTAAILWGASCFSSPIAKTTTLKDALWIGGLQGLALIPGISRSAATIGAGRWRGLSSHEAVRFSFLLSLPAIAGGTFLELLKLPSHPTAIPLSSCFLGFAAAAVTGLLMVRVAIPLLQRGVLRPFAGYCLIGGILLTLYL